MQGLTKLKIYVLLFLPEEGVEEIDIVTVEPSGLVIGSIVTVLGFKELVAVEYVGCSDVAVSSMK